jgi:hypothetical protein
MDITSIAAAASANSSMRTQSAVQLTVLKKAIDTQAAGALALIQAIPASPTPPASVGTEGGFVDTWA